MAKHDHKDQQNQASTPAPVDTAPAPVAVDPAAVVAPDERYRKLTLDDAGSVFGYGDTSKSGQSVNRIDFIRSSWTGQGRGQGFGQARGAIAKELTRLAGKKITYQIVFSATKGLAGGPAPAPAVATPGTAAA